MAPAVVDCSDDVEAHQTGIGGDFEIAIPQVPITEQRKPFVSTDDEPHLVQAGVPRVNIAASVEAPYGTQKGDWAMKFSHETVLQQHVDFFDRDYDGIIWPQDTYIGFRRLGYNISLSFLALLVIHFGFSYLTLPPGHWLPDPFFRIYKAHIHKAKHGSDTGTYDNEGRYIPQKFEDIFAKYGSTDGKDHGEQAGLTLKEAISAMSGQRVAFDPFGWSAAAFEWIATYLLLWPEDGLMKKEDIRRVYDGSLFYEIAARREKQKSVPLNSNQ